MFPEKHLDVGVRTGYFLDRCRFPFHEPRNHSLRSKPGQRFGPRRLRLRRYSPVCHLGNVLEPAPEDFAGFHSVGLNYLLHCLPGDLLSKSVVFKNLKPLLKENGVIFGSTILGSDCAHNLLGRKLMNLYNRKGISFSNVSDCRTWIWSSGSENTSASTACASRDASHFLAP